MSSCSCKKQLDFESNCTILSLHSAWKWGFGFYAWKQYSPTMNHNPKVYIRQIPGNYQTWHGSEWGSCLPFHYKTWRQCIHKPHQSIWSRMQSVGEQWWENWWEKNTRIWWENMGKASYWKTHGWTFLLRPSIQEKTHLMKWEYLLKWCGHSMRNCFSPNGQLGFTLK